MINWFNIPDEGLSNGGLFEVKELEVTENGTYETKGEMYNKVTVNVEGGGGESDFSTAEVTLNLAPPEDVTFIETALDSLRTEYPNENFDYKCPYLPSINNKCSVLLYQGRAIVDSVIGTTEDYSVYNVIVGTPITTGGVTWNSEDSFFEITGDGTITAVVSNRVPA